MRHPRLVERRPNCVRQSLASTPSAPRVAATSYCHPGRHANVITPCLLTPCLNAPKSWAKFLGQKSCRTKVSRIFRIFVPNFAPNFAPNFPRIFRGLFVLRFVGNGDQKKFTKNPRRFSMQNSQANTKKIFTKFFWRARNVTSSFPSD